MVCPPYTTRACPGMTLLEAMVATGIFAGFLALICLTMNYTVTGYEVGSIQASLQMQADAILDQIAHEIKDSGDLSPVWSYSSTTPSTITFSRCNGYASGAPTWGNTITYSVVSYSWSNPDDQALYGSMYCLQRAEVTSSGTVYRILTQKLYGGGSYGSLIGTTSSNETVQFQYINFTYPSVKVPHAVIISISLYQPQPILLQNVNTSDDIGYVIAQVTVPLVNDQ